MARHLSSRVALFAAVAATAGLALTGCSTISTLLSGDSDKDTDTTTTTATDSPSDDAASDDTSTDDTSTDSDTTSVFDIHPGDCASMPPEGDVENLDLISCDEPHDVEVYYEFNIPEGDGTYPGEDSVTEQADQGCYDAFEDFIGISYDDSTLYYNYFYPTEDTWTDTSLQDRLVSCLVYQVEDYTDANSDIVQTTGTLKDSQL
ncbi:MAG: septum formation family protein [Microbacterium sp.]